jgi:hypothetical protein
MELKFESGEVADLREALDAFDKVLLAELAKADDRDYRKMLREKIRRYEALLKRFEPTAPDRHAA